MLLLVFCIHSHVGGHAGLFMCAWGQRWLWISFSAALCPTFWAWRSLFCLSWLAIENLGSTSLWHPSLGITGWCSCAPTLCGCRERIWTHVFLVAQQELHPLNHFCSPIIVYVFIYFACLFYINSSLRYLLCCPGWSWTIGLKSLSCLNHWSSVCRTLGFVYHWCFWDSVSCNLHGAQIHYV